MKDVPRVFSPFVSSVINVIGDGNCGYRVMTKFMYGDEEKWLIVRQQLISEQELNMELYISVFGSVDRYNELYETFPWTKSLHPHHSG